MPKSNSHFYVRVAACILALFFGSGTVQAGYLSSGVDLYSNYLQSSTVDGHRAQILTSDVDLFTSWFDRVGTDPLFLDIDLKLSEQTGLGNQSGNGFRPYLQQLSVRYTNRSHGYKLRAGRMFLAVIPESTLFDGVAFDIPIADLWRAGVFIGRDISLEQARLSADSLSSFDNSRLGMQVSWADPYLRGLRTAIYARNFQDHPLPYLNLSGSADGGLPWQSSLRWTLASDIDIPLLFDITPEVGIVGTLLGDKWQERVSFRSIVPDFAYDSIFWAFRPSASNLAEESFTYEFSKITLAALYQFGSPVWLPAGTFAQWSSLWSHFAQVTVSGSWQGLAYKPGLYAESSPDWQAVGTRFAINYLWREITLFCEPFLELRSTTMADRTQSYFGGAQIQIWYSLRDQWQLFANLGGATGSWMSPYLSSTVGFLWRR